MYYLPVSQFILSSQNHVKTETGLKRAPQGKSACIDQSAELKVPRSRATLRWIENAASGYYLI